MKRIYMVLSIAILLSFTSFAQTNVQNKYANIENTGIKILTIKNEKYIKLTDSNVDKLNSIIDGYNKMVAYEIEKEKNKDSNRVEVIGVDNLSMSVKKYYEAKGIVMSDSFDTSGESIKRFETEYISKIRELVNTSSVNKSSMMYIKYMSAIDELLNIAKTKSVYPNEAMYLNSKYQAAFESEYRKLTEEKK